MMVQKIRWRSSILGYFLYTVAVLVVMLWVLFPVDFFQQWIPAYLTARFPHARVALTGVEIRFPGKLVLSDLEVLTSAEGKELLKVETLELQPELKKLLSLQPVVSYMAMVSEGRVAGTVSSSLSFDAFNVTGQVEQLPLDSVSGIQVILEREILGSLNARFKGKVQGNFTALGEIHVEASIDNGQVGLKKDILGHTFLPFSQVSFTVTGNEEELVVVGGQVESELFSAGFAGEIEPRIPYAQSELSLAGTVQPRTEFFAHVADEQLLSVIRSQLPDGGVPFKISGEVAQPGINFGELSSLFQATTTSVEQ